MRGGAPGPAVDRNRRWLPHPQRGRREVDLLVRPGHRAVGDHVVSTFFPDWIDGEPQAEGFSRTPGDGIDGYAREQVTMPATAFTHAPHGHSDAEAATLTTAGLTAWRALMHDGSLKPGETVLIQGTGGVSIFAPQFAKLAGAQVIATSSSDAKLARLKELGADELINYRSDPEWGMSVRQFTGGRGVDHVIEVGGPSTLHQSMLASRVGGHIAVIGVLNGLNAALVRRAATVDGRAAAALLPYAVWVGFATALNGSIWRRNR